MEEKQERFVTTKVVLLIKSTYFCGMENKTDTTDVVKQWILAHDLINLAGLCKKSKVDKSNFNKWLKGDKPLSENALLNIMEQLFPYGFKWYELPKEEIPVAKTVNQTIKKETILISTKENPQMPVREDGEDQFDFAQRKNEWKKLHGK